MATKKGKLVEELRRIAADKRGDPEVAKSLAEKTLLRFIDDPEVTEAFNSLPDYTRNYTFYPPEEQVMRVKVIFEYDEKSKKWDPVVNGATSELEARQAFSAVVLTCHELPEALLNVAKTKIIDSFNVRIIPAV